LMQMGRWFGFRKGYMDLVRLFIGCREPKGKSTVDLYESFGAVCRDEEALRKDLLKYSKSDLLPCRVPPLIEQHMPQLKPTSRNKMFNAEIKSIDYAGEWTEKTVASNLAGEMKTNLDNAGSLFNKSKISPSIEFSFINSKGKLYKLNARIGITSGEAILAFLKEYKWAVTLNPIRLEIDYIEMMRKKNKFNSWHILLPQLQSPQSWKLPNTNFNDLSIVERKRSDTRFSAYSDPAHRDVASFLSGCSKLQGANGKLQRYRNFEIPVLLMYFVKEKDVENSGITVGFGIHYPGQKTEKAKTITWTVKDKTNADAVVTDFII